MVTNLLIWLEFKNNNLFQSILLLRDSEGCPYFPLICNCEIMFDKTISYIVCIFVLKKFKGDISNFPKCHPFHSSIPSTTLWPSIMYVHIFTCYLPPPFFACNTQWKCLEDLTPSPKVHT